MGFFAFRSFCPVRVSYPWLPVPLLLGQLPTVIGRSLANSLTVATSLVCTGCLLEALVPFPALAVGTRSQPIRQLASWSCLDCRSISSNSLSGWRSVVGSGQTPGHDRAARWIHSRRPFGHQWIANKYQE